MTAGNHVKAGTNRLGKCSLELLIERHQEKEYQQQEKLDALHSEWAKMIHDTNEFTKENKPQVRWTVKECQITLKSLRRDKTEKIPKRKHNLIALFEQLKCRTPLAIDDVGVSNVVDGDGDDLSGGDDAAEFVDNEANVV